MWAKVAFSGVVRITADFSVAVRAKVDFCREGVQRQIYIICGVVWVMVDFNGAVWVKEDFSAVLWVKVGLCM